MLDLILFLVCSLSYEWFHPTATRADETELPAD